VAPAACLFFPTAFCMLPGRREAAIVMIDRVTEVSVRWEPYGDTVMKSPVRSVASQHAKRCSADHTAKRQFLPGRRDNGGHGAELNPPRENRLLMQLSASDFSWLHPHLKMLVMTGGTILHPTGAPIEYVYFPVSGMVSIVTLMRSGESIETAIVGREGVVGAAVAYGALKSAGQAVGQISGCIWQIHRDKFVEAYKSNAAFGTLIDNFQSTILLQAQQSAACHALHSVEARLCRWLLQSQDTTETDTIPLTHEFLSHMLGVQRNSVSLAAHALQNSGLINYHRGEIRILDRSGLKESACECYEVVREYIDNAVPPLVEERAYALRSR
jgi:CRP-like cAMP-binding protein